MSEYINKAKLYEEIVKLEELALDKFLDTPVCSPIREKYKEQMLERTNLKLLVSEFETEDITPIVHGKWIVKLNDDAWNIKCSNCGRIFDRFVNGLVLPEYCFCGAKMDLKK